MELSQTTALVEAFQQSPFFFYIRIHIPQKRRTSSIWQNIRNATLMSFSQKFKRL